VTAKKKK